ncbi:glutamate-rich protein [Leptolyngbya sp. Heron Island J]|uniref:GrpB family protein n=1 Tax=Leptolyngbya sp. Heron Island J TaxID=1385935 RepID=UPI0003B9DDE7|nr:GrpB family protein [Leptolyngbya sp. Heron Island J]ESA34314.1 glutamate-rich protein [Leptolyngbya sp. Heron Island J]
MASAPVELSAYHSEWPIKFEAEKTRLITNIGQWLWGSVEHVGSTAVPGLLAKPVIDIMFGVQSLQDSRPAIDVLVNHGYQYFPYKKEVMHWFCKPSDEFRTHHLHLIPYKSQLWQDRIRFRDLLRANQKIANDYAILKQSLAASYRYDREAYTQAKGPFIQQTLKLVQ